MVWKRRLTLGCGLVLLSCAALVAAAAWLVLGLPPAAYGPLPVPRGPMLIRNGTVFDGTEVHPGWDMLVTGDRITCVAKLCPAPADAVIWDATDRFVMPGLLDAHVHWLIAEHGLFSFNAGSPQTRRAYLEAGVTTVRSLADTPFRVEQQRTGAENGFAGPRFIAAGPVFTAPGGHPMNHWKNGPSFLTDAAIEVTTGPEASAHAARLLDEGFDGIKVVYDDGTKKRPLPRVDVSVVRALTATANARDRWIAVHAQSDEEVRVAAELGVNTIEHGFIWDDPSEPTLALLRQRRSVVVPTLAAAQHAFRASMGKDKGDHLVQRLQDRARLLHDSGIAVGVGSDNQVGMTMGTATIDEILLLHGAGIPMLDVLRGATRINADAINRPDLGRLEEGALADVLVLPGDPRIDPTHLRHPNLVLSGGAIAVNTTP